MGEAKRRRDAQTAGKQWPRPGAPAVPKPRSSQEFLDQLAPELRAEFFRIFAATRAATRDALAEIRGSTGDARSRRLASLARGRHAELESIVATAFESSAEGRATRDAVACRKGCYFCCHINVQVTIPDAILVASAIRAGRFGRFAATVRATADRIRGLAPAERYRQAVPCPMLENGACGIYDVRPTACRAYLATDARKCEASLESARTTGLPTPVESLAYPQQISAAINGAVLQACADEGLQNCAVELTLATDLILRDDTAVERWLSGETVFEPYRSA